MLAENKRGSNKNAYKEKCTAYIPLRVTTGCI
jgi:hypothetical protein